MPQLKDPPALYNPALLPAIEQDYYRTMWGFDPVTACQILDGGPFRYEACIDLPQDMPLQMLGVMICARVDWWGEDIHNRIVFRRGETEASVECTHTNIYRPPGRDTRRSPRPGPLPPWEHFAALKWFVAAVADAGVLALLDQFAAGRRDPVVQFTTNRGNPDGYRSWMDQFAADRGNRVGFNYYMYWDVLDALEIVAPSVLSSIAIMRSPFDELIEKFRQASKANREHAPAEIQDAEEEFHDEFCRFQFPHHLRGPWSGPNVPAGMRLARVQQYLREVVQKYGSDEFEVAERGNQVPVYDPEALYCADIKDWATESLEHLTVAPVPPRPQDTASPPSVPLRPLPPALQVTLAAHSDYAARLGLVGNPSTVPSTLLLLRTDPLPCVRAATSARLRRGTTTIEPLVGEVLDPGEMMWFFAAHPGIWFDFGVTTWGDGSPAYADWFASRMRADPRWEGAIGKGYAWMYENGEYSEYAPDDERGPSDFNFADRGWIDHACGHFPCVYLGSEGWLTGKGPARI